MQILASAFPLRAAELNVATPRLSRPVRVRRQREWMPLCRICFPRKFKKDSIYLRESRQTDLSRPAKRLISDLSLTCRKLTRFDKTAATQTTYFWLLTDLFLTRKGKQEKQNDLFPTALWLISDMRAQVMIFCLGGNRKMQTSTTALWLISDVKILVWLIFDFYPTAYWLISDVSLKNLVIFTSCYNDLSLTSL